MSMHQVRPAIYVGSLLDLNNGITHGVWLDASQPVETMLAAITSMLDTSPTMFLTGEPAEEWLILDNEGFAQRIDPHDTLELVRSSTTNDLNDTADA